MKKEWRLFGIGGLGVIAAKVYPSYDLDTQTEIELELPTRIITEVDRQSGAIRVGMAPMTITDEQLGLLASAHITVRASAIDYTAWPSDKLADSLEETYRVVKKATSVEKNRLQLLGPNGESLQS